MFIQGDQIKLHKDLNKEFSLATLLQDDLEYVFRGNFTPEIVAGILDLAGGALDKSSDTSKIKAKIYFIMGESLQNIARHHIESFNESPDRYSLFAIHKRNFKYYITTGNLIEAEEISSLKEKIDTINSMKKNELREYSRSTRSNGFSDKGGAGIGLIEMAKRSGNRLEYDFRKIDETHSYFYLNTEIPIQQQDIPETVADYKFSIENIKELHDILVNDNVILFFKGAFNQSSLLNILSIVESQLNESTITIKIYNLMVEMLQNISKHADNYSHEIDWKPGLFLITETDDNYVLISGNYIKNEKVDSFRKKLKQTNELDSRELTKRYNQTLLDFDLENSENGLGLLDLKKKSKENLIYNFHKIDEDLSFFMLQVVVKKANNMNALIIEDTKETPRIHFDPANNIFEISSRSLPEDADDFYVPIINWLESYADKPNAKTNFTFKLDYYNTASARYITKMIKILNDLGEDHAVKVYWYYREIDEDMEAMGEEYNDMTDIDIELIEF